MPDRNLRRRGGGLLVKTPQGGEGWKNVFKVLKYEVCLHKEGSILIDQEDDSLTNDK